jgi:hypothetical protein
MRVLLRWVFGTVVFLSTSGLGAASGIFAAFWYIYFFVDQDRTGNADVATNISFFVAALGFGFVGLILGALAAWRLLVWWWCTSRTEVAAIRAESVH